MAVDAKGVPPKIGGRFTSLKRDVDVPALASLLVAREGEKGSRQPGEYGSWKLSSRGRSIPPLRADASLLCIFKRKVGFVTFPGPHAVLANPRSDWRPCQPHDHGSRITGRGPAARFNVLPSCRLRHASVQRSNGATSSCTPSSRSPFILSPLFFLRERTCTRAALATFSCCRQVVDACAISPAAPVAPSMSRGRVTIVKAARHFVVR